MTPKEDILVVTLNALPFLEYLINEKVISHGKYKYEVHKNCMEKAIDKKNRKRTCWRKYCRVWQFLTRFTLSFYCKNVLSRFFPHEVDTLCSKLEDKDNIFNTICKKPTSAIVIHYNPILKVFKYDKLKCNIIKLNVLWSSF